MRTILACWLSSLAIPTFLVAALDTPACLLADFFDQEGRLTGRAGLIDGTIPERILTFRIVSAGEERSPLLGTLLNEVSSTVRLWAFHA